MEREGARAAGVAASLCLLGAPAVAEANSFEGLGVVVAAMAVGLPCAVLQIALIVVASIWGRKSVPPSRARRVFARISLVLSGLLVLAFVVAALVLEGEPSGRLAPLIAAASVPLLVLGGISTALAVRLLRRG
jgi:hypothetical protein